jgi:glucose-6-phosphate 1-dehydrogenase
MTDEELRDSLRAHLKGDKDKVESFLELCTYVHGDYAPGSPGYADLLAALHRHEGGAAATPVGRLFYLALPPFVYPQVRAFMGGCGVC